MGSHANFYLIIRYLVTLKRELHRVTKDKYQPVIQELSSYEVYPHSDNEHLPDNKALAAKLNYTQGKMNSLLKDLLKELVGELNYPPIEIKDHVHQFLIHLPWDEEREFKNKDYLQQVKQESIFIQMKLPVTPRIGEEIEIPFIEETGKFYRGYIHEIKHRITGTTQEILYFVHPWHDYYYRLQKMKDDYERRKKWVANS